MATQQAHEVRIPALTAAATTLQRTVGDPSGVPRSSSRSRSRCSAQTSEQDMGLPEDPRRDRCRCQRGRSFPIVASHRPRDERGGEDGLHCKPCFG
jgi:hypothetical protein